MSTTIIDFWKANRAYWITPPSKQREVDELIRDKFWGFYEPVRDNLIGRIIYIDQFSRHFQRLGLIREEAVREFRLMVVDIIHMRIDELESMDEIEIVFALMPFKHLQKYDFVFEYLHNTWLKAEGLKVARRKLIDLPDLQRFYVDTYKKAFTFDAIQKKITTSHPPMSYDASLICDYYPDTYQREDWNLYGVAGEKLLDLLEFNQRVIVSLSGGVDSMVMLSLLKYKGVDVEAVHIVYGNRLESEHEYSFLAEFCRKIDVKLSVYRIQWLRRGEVDRQFYEDMTRDIRFNVYKSFGEGTSILLGHIKDDIVENIWTNITHCHHLDNLKKMRREEVQLGVKIVRPFLSAEKADIYRISETVGIPYLKNTTPSWSNRGKFREHFHAATVAQFGAGVDEKLIEFAEAVESQNKLLNMLLYDPIYASFKDNTVNITTAVKAQLDANSWLRIFEHVCHTRLGIARPAIKCVRDFCQRLYRPWEKLHVEMGKGVKVQITRDGESVYMRFITL
jgi:tRNA(Ile)-lysidine synthetase-like protein